MASTFIKIKCMFAFTYIKNDLIIWQGFKILFIVT